MSDSEIKTFIAWIFFVLFLILLSAIFSGIETAITAVNRLKIKNLSDKNDRKAKTLEKLLEHPGRVITTILIGNNLANVAASALATAVAIMYFDGHLANIALITTIVIIIMTLVILIFGEIIPKNFSILRAERISLASSHVVKAITTLMLPVTMVLSHFTRTIIKFIDGTIPEKGSLVKDDELNYILKMSNEEGILEEEEKEMIQGVIDMNKSIAREIMTPRTDMACVEINMSVQEVIDVIRSTGHSRIPVYENRIDNVKGIIFAKDLLNVGAEEKKNDIVNYIKKAHYVPETKKVDDLLTEMKKTKHHIAIVVDEYGGTSGVISIEDILELIVGEIQDEYDEEEPPPMIKLSDNNYLFSAGISIDEVNEELNITIPEEEDYDTLGGFLCALFGRIPSQGDTMKWENLLFKIDKVERKRILQVGVNILPEDLGLEGRVQERQ
ncbi:MAG: hemolysin family protein [bacterium]